jgi:hypothetical protein
MAAREPSQDLAARYVGVEQVLGKIVLRQCFVYNARPELMTGKSSYSLSFIFHKKTHLY